MSTLTYIVDFDDCLFDTARLKQVLERYGIDTAARSHQSIEAVQARVGAEAVDLHSYLFPDAVAWLQENGAQCHIVTSYVGRTETHFDETGLRAFQEAKLAAAAIYEYVAPERVHIVAADKSAMVRELKALHDTATLVFIDNHPDHLAVGQEVGMTPVQIVRTSHVPDGVPSLTEHVSWPIIYSFAELATLTDWLFANTQRGEDLLG